MTKQVSALVLFSGGLDSILAVKILQNLGINATALTFKSAFWETTKAEESAKAVKVPLIIADMSEKHLEIVKKPRYGYGVAANPCLDCHLLMLRLASHFLKKPKNTLCVNTIPPRGWNSLTPKVKFSANGRPAFGWNFIATGEVLGQRPFSQHKKALALLAKESDLSNLLLRPLSAKLLPATKPERLGWIDRTKLEAIEGRNRARQIELAKKFGIADYPQPAGGCLLCERVFGAKLKKMFIKWPDCSVDDVQLLRLGRHFWEGKTLITLGRNKEENEKLAQGVTPQTKDLRIVSDTPGPTALIRGKTPQAAEKRAKKLMAKYS